MTKYLTSETQIPPYLAFPKFLLETNISETAKLLYMLLLDRARLSMKNDGWTDEVGHVFVTFTISDMADVLHRGEMTVKNSLRSLEGNSLIERRHRGLGIPNQIYVKIPSDKVSETNGKPPVLGTENCPHGRQKAVPSEDKKLSSRRTENCPSEGQKTVLMGDRKLSGNKNNKSNTDLVKGESNISPSPYGRYQNVFLTDSELSELKQDIPEWNGYIEKLSSYMKSNGKKYQNHAATIRSWALRDAPAPRSSYECGEDESL
ncbi:MAG: replication initiator protein A [Clostridia bacterium]|nr:replication initiator protein A [Clostridia bacterium]